MNSTMAMKKTPWAEELKKLRDARDLDQVEAAELVGVPVGTYRNWEQGRALPNSFTREEVSRILKRGKK